MYIGCVNSVVNHNFTLTRAQQCLHSLYVHIIGVSLSEPHIDELAVEFVYIHYIYIYIFLVRRAVSHLRLLFCARSCIIH